VFGVIHDFVCQDEVIKIATFRHFLPCHRTKHGNAERVECFDSLIVFELLASKIYVFNGAIIGRL
jgi:hypothetical protein